MTKAAVLFVCLGNICRSPLAEAAFRKACNDSGVSINIDSAGTGNWHIGDAPDKRAQAVARKHGVDISDYRARQVRPADFDQYTHLVAMDRANLRDLLAIKPDSSSAKVLLLPDGLNPEGELEVDDPYYGEAAGFEQTWATVARGTRALLASLTSTA